jgi:hypothetical protein
MTNMKKGNHQRITKNFVTYQGSPVTQQLNGASLLYSLISATMKRKHYYVYASEIEKRFSSSEDGVECWTEDSMVRESFEWRHPIVGAGKWQVNDGLYDEVPLWCASGPISRWWIVPTCVWKLYDCKNGSECWKIATRGPVGRIL